MLYPGEIIQLMCCTQCRSYLAFVKVQRKVKCRSWKGCKLFSWTNRNTCWGRLVRKNGKWVKQWVNPRTGLSHHTHVYLNLAERSAFYTWENVLRKWNFSAQTNTILWLNIKHSYNPRFNQKGKLDKSLTKYFIRCSSKSWNALSLPKLCGFMYYQRIRNITRIQVNGFN